MAFDFSILNYSRWTFPHRHYHHYHYFQHYYCFFL
ncbi:unnamed protein product [Schistosoma curassoni]|uniref:Uncharacterized protein n=1 Tax=Schistosoma curassoni TaxID=6186 RepID=A0A183KG16_9TREM|nr:unnamed protein product [Schistosoma curassoni]